MSDVFIIGGMSKATEIKSSQIFIYVDQVINFE